MRKQIISTLTAVIASVALHSCTEGTRPEQPTTTDTIVVAPQPELMFGLPIDSFAIERYTVGKNDMLATILLRAGISYAEINKASELAEPKYSVRSIKRGNNYTLFFKPDTMHQLQHFVYEINAKSYLTLSFHVLRCVLRVY